MSQEKRTFTMEAKLQILKQASGQGVNATLSRHGIYPTIYYNWKKKFEQMGEDGFRHGVTPEHLKEIRALQKENELLKILLAE